ncbi:MAG: TIGR02588 family protein [Mesorhizobium sp.]|uniref:TIGR02588 family protein n=1 Tax=Mesorhizobium sp. TaxID=1871066 RepID=UPI000FE586CE|nr:TIGR02588 family protein [Mesorhizobium sp.]RWM14876.1 MAG: TIGR02588 family protein [Mesorhizobium sp.]TIP70920.1 MAG: TIGR02588 family protein [Mesorhizobium sp.]TIQ08338.1 MAG: TIGR02588 family protein [Mesorhizobium sp.]TIR49309.1 MAG: TIGR02588 family protein [Mesorhizobium sp.]TJV95027.1 MAG: TIGR02588 family protein [Mesorhizobium sp.]
MTKNPAKGDKQQKQQSDDKGKTRKSGTSLTEWVVAGISSVALLAVLSYLVIDGLSARNGTARIVVLPLAVAATEGGYVVEFAAANRAGKSVAAVEIKGELRNGDEVVEESSATLDYVPQESQRKGALIFRRDPEAYDLRLFASGYSEP